MVEQSGIFWKRSDLHPKALTLDDAPLVAGEIDAETLQANIALLNPGPNIRNLRCVVPRPLGAEVLRAAGFARVDLCRIISVPLPTDWSVHDTPLTFHWHHPNDPVDWETWYQAHWESYDRTHQINPARDPGRAAYSELFGEDMVAALFAYLRDDLVGIASLRPDQEVGWLDTRFHAPNLLAAILKATLEHATLLGWSHAEIEVDDAGDPVLSALTRAFDHCPQAHFDIWQRPLRI